MPCNTQKYLDASAHSYDTPRCAPASSHQHTRADSHDTPQKSAHAPTDQYETPQYAAASSYDTPQKSAYAPAYSYNTPQTDDSNHHWDSTNSFTVTPAKPMPVSHQSYIPEADDNTATLREQLWDSRHAGALAYEGWRPPTRAELHRNKKTQWYSGSQAAGVLYGEEEPALSNLVPELQAQNPPCVAAPWKPAGPSVRHKQRNLRGNGDIICWTNVG